MSQTLLLLLSGSWLLADLLDTAVLAAVFARHSSADVKGNFGKLIFVSVVQNNWHLRTDVQVLQLNKPGLI